MKKEDRTILEAKLINKLMNLTEEEAALILQVMDIVEGNQEKEALVMDLLKTHNIKTEEGKAAFLEALRAA